MHAKHGQKDIPLRILGMEDDEFGQGGPARSA